MTEVSIALPNVVSREEWLAARKELLAQEKEATRLRDAVNAARARPRPGSNGRRSAKAGRSR